MMDLKDFFKSPKLGNEVVESLHLLDGFKVILDRFWGRIWLTELETRLMDSESFQLLRWKLQLGPTLLVYPGATHTRFEHSLGAMRGVESIVESCNKNSRRYGTRYIEPYEYFLARLSGLLHDIAQMPWGHTLKDEGHVFEVEWTCRDIRNELLSPNGVIPKILLKFFTEKWGHLPPNVRKKLEAKEFVETVKGDLTWLLRKGISGVRERPPRNYLAFISDIVGNTLSGDLFDYVQRDISSLGLPDGVSPVPLEFLVVKNVQQGNVLIPRLVLALWKPAKPNKMRKDVIRDAVDFFDKRCSLAEKVYFHHAKVAASAMMIKAVHLSKMTCGELWRFGDGQLLVELSSWKVEDSKADEAQTIPPQVKIEAEKQNKTREDLKLSGMIQEEPDTKVVRSLATKLRSRQLYKCVFECNYKEIMAARMKERMLRFCNEETSAEEQRKYEKQLSSYFPDIAYGDIVVYCPDINMNMKPFETLVWQTKDETPTKLEKLEVEDFAISHDISSIKRRHQELWGFKVFVNARKLNDELRSQVRTACRNLLFEEKPEYALAGIWIDNYRQEVIGELKSRLASSFSQEAVEANLKNAVTKLIRDGQRKRGEKTPGAPTVGEVSDLIVERSHK